MTEPPDAAVSPRVIAHRGPDGFANEQPRLQLVSESPAQLPNLTGRRIASVRFTAQAVELDFGGLRVSVQGITRIICGPEQHVFPEPGSRDALCSLIGTRVERMRSGSAEGIEVLLDSGCILVIPRAGAAVA